MLVLAATAAALPADAAKRESRLGGLSRLRKSSGSRKKAAPTEPIKIGSRAFHDKKLWTMDLWVHAQAGYAGTKLELWNRDEKIADLQLEEGEVPCSIEIPSIKNVACAKVTIPLPPANKPYSITVRKAREEETIGTVSTDYTIQRYKRRGTYKAEQYYDSGEFFRRYISMPKVFDTMEFPEPEVKDPGAKGGGRSGRSAKLGGASRLRSRSRGRGKKEEEAKPESAVKNLKDFLGEDYAVEATYYNDKGAMVSSARIPGKYKAVVSVKANGKTYRIEQWMERKPNAKDMANISKGDETFEEEMNLFKTSATLDFDRGWIAVSLVSDAKRLLEGKAIELYNGETRLAKGRLQAASRKSTRVSASFKFPIMPAGTTYGGLDIKLLGKSVGKLKVADMKVKGTNASGTPQNWFTGGIGMCSDWEKRDAWVHGQFFERFLVLDNYMLKKPEFPEVTMLDPKRFKDARMCPVRDIKEYIGEYTLETTFLDSEFKPVQSPQKTGGYIAKILVKTADGPTYKVFRAMCRPPVSSFFKDKKIAEAVAPHLAGKTEKDALMVAGAVEAQLGHHKGTVEEVANLWWIKFQFGEKIPIDTPYKYVAHPPIGLAQYPDKKWPAIFYFHGGGGGGWDWMMQKGGLGFLFHTGVPERREYFCICPNSEGGNWSSRKMKQLVDICMALYPLDPDRMAMTGHSRGSAAAMGCAAAYPEYFMALIPCAHASMLGPPQIKRLKENNVAVWQFCGEFDDTALQKADLMFKFMKDEGLNARYTRLPGWGHGTEHYAFMGDPLVWKWLATLNKKLPCLIPEGGMPGEDGGKGKSRLRSRSTLKRRSSLKSRSTLKSGAGGSRIKKKSRLGGLRGGGEEEEAPAAPGYVSSKMLRDDPLPPLPQMQQKWQEWMRNFDPMNFEAVQNKGITTPGVRYPCGTSPFYITQQSIDHWNYWVAHSNSPIRGKVGPGIVGMKMHKGVDPGAAGKIVAGAGPLAGAPGATGGSGAASALKMAPREKIPIPSVHDPALAGQVKVSAKFDPAKGAITIKVTIPESAGRLSPALVVGKKTIGRFRMSRGKGAATGETKIPYPGLQEIPDYDALCLKVGSRVLKLVDLPRAQLEAYYTSYPSFFLRRCLDVDKPMFSRPQWPKIELKDSLRKIRKFDDEDMLGPHVIRTTFYNADYKVVSAPDVPGRYAAEIEVECAGGKTMRHVAVLCYYTRDSARKLPREALAAAKKGGDMGVRMMAAGYDQLGGADGTLEDLDAKWMSGFLSKKNIKVSLPAVEKPKCPFGYAVSLPRSYSTMPDKKWPLVIHLHGGGYTGSADALMRIFGPFARKHFVVVTLRNNGTGWWNTENVIKTTKVLSEYYRVDKNKIFLTGHSIGAMGSLHAAAAAPDLFAGVAAANGVKSPPQAAATLAKHGVGVWVLCGDGDWPNLDDMHRWWLELVKAGCHARYTVIACCGHGGEYYMLPRKAIFEWMLTLDKRKLKSAAGGGGGRGRSSRRRSTRRGGLGSRLGARGGEEVESEEEKLARYAKMKPLDRIADIMRSIDKKDWSIVTEWAKNNPKAKRADPFWPMITGNDWKVYAGLEWPWFESDAATSYAKSNGGPTDPIELLEKRLQQEGR
jgi:predicted peptidase